MTKIRLLLLFFVLFIVGQKSLIAQPKTDSVRVLFIGNSYTYGNDLPELLAQLMAGKGIKFGYESVTVGGATLKNSGRTVKPKRLFIVNPGTLSSYT